MVRLVASFSIAGRFVPFNYNYHLASALFQRLREAGYRVHGSSLCYSFSRLLFRDGVRVEKGFRASQADLVISTPSAGILTVLAEALFLSPSLRVRGVELHLVDVRVGEGPKDGWFRTLSPVTAYRSRRGWKTFFTPEDEEFYWIVEEELRKKFRSLYGRDPAGEFRLTVKEWSETVVMVKGTPYVACDVVGRVEGGELRDFALEAGLGRKTHFGFGCLGELRDE